MMRHHVVSHSHLYHRLTNYWKPLAWRLAMNKSSPSWSIPSLVIPPCDLSLTCSMAQHDKTLTVLFHTLGLFKHAGSSPWTVFFFFFLLYWLHPPMPNLVILSFVQSSLAVYLPTVVPCSAPPLHVECTFFLHVSHCYMLQAIVL